MKHFLIISFLVFIFLPGISQADYSNSEITKLVLLGTGNPNPDPNHSGCALALIVNNTPYIIDFGPGVIRQAAAASPRYGGNISGLSTKNIKTAFVTHLHSDHTAGYPDLILTPWVMGRDEPLEVYGPIGIKEMTDNILKAYQEDIRYRVYGEEPANDNGWRVNTHEIKEGICYEDSNITVEAFKVLHGSWPNAFGYRFTTPDKIIVVSGDTKPCDNIIKYSKNADILVHEVYYKAGYDTKNELWKRYHANHHTSTYELGEIAKKCNPGKIILYHILFWGASEQQLLNEIKEVYDGDVYVGHDLDIF